MQGIGAGRVAKGDENTNVLNGAPAGKIEINERVYFAQSMVLPAPFPESRFWG